MVLSKNISVRLGLQYKNKKTWQKLTVCQKNNIGGQYKWAAMYEEGNSKDDTKSFTQENN